MSMLSSRFALGRPVDGTTYGRPPGTGSSTTTVRPFGLRFFRPAAAATGPEIAYRYCPIRQMSVVDDGTDEPLITRIMNWDQTTTGEFDGKGKPSEEWKLDYRVDA